MPGCIRDAAPDAWGRRVIINKKLGLKGAGTDTADLDELTYLIESGSDRIDDLKIPPGNHLEALKGDRSGQHSIRINNQWRVCFCWTDAGAEDVEMVDYH